MLLPYNAADRSANPRWLRDALGPRITIQGPHQGAWLIVRAHTDTVLAAMIERFGHGVVTVVHDVATQQACGPSCQNANPMTALQCECSCGGVNHGGYRGLPWQLRNDYAINTNYRRTVWLA